MPSRYIKPLPSWDEGPMDDEFLNMYASLQSSAYIDSFGNRGISVPDITEARTAGYALAKALCAVFVTRGDHSGYSQLLVIARYFSKISGYRTLDDGGEFMDGFIDGYASMQPKQIVSEVKKEE